MLFYNSSQIMMSHCVSEQDVVAGEYFDRLNVLYTLTDKNVIFRTMTRSVQYVLKAYTVMNMTL